MLTRYFNIVRRWLWLLTLATLVAGTTTYWLSSQETTLYQAKARLIIGPGIDSPNPDLNALRTGAQLMQTYAELATMQPVLQAVADDLKLDTRLKQLDEQITIKVNKEAQILSISVQDGDPNRATAIANTLADMLVRLSPSNPNSAQAKLKEQIRDQVKKLETSVASSETIIGQLEAEFQATSDAEKQRQLMDQLSQERARLTETHQTLATLYDSLQEASVNQVQIVELASFGKPVASQLRLKVLIGAIAGLVLGGVVALAFEYLNNAIGTAEELAQTTNIPLLGAIARHKKLRGPGREQMVVQALPQSKAAENYRMLGTKLLAKYRAEAAHYRVLAGAGLAEGLPAGNHHSLRSLLVSGSQMEDDPSVVAANLALVLAQTDLRVVLVDAYLHHPTIGQLFDLDDRVGLTGTLTDESRTPKPIPVDGVPTLSILPGGPVPSNPFELLASSRMADLIEELESQADLVIIAGSPLLSFADGLIMASRVDGVVMVAHSGKTNSEMLDQAVESLYALETHIIGSILNYNPPRRLPGRARLRQRPRHAKRLRQEGLQAPTVSHQLGDKSIQPDQSTPPKKVATP